MTPPHPANLHALEHLAGPPSPLNGADTAQAPHRFAFLLVPGFSYIGFASAIEPLRLANMVADEPCFAAVTCSIHGDGVAASNGITTVPDHAIDDLPDAHALFVCGPNPIHFPQEQRLVRWLRRLSGNGVALGGIDTGSYLLAQAALLNGYRCTIHWQDMPTLMSRFPRIIVSEHIFELDRQRYTCSGGTAAMDMMLGLIGQYTGKPEIAAAAADLLVHERVRDRLDRQRIPLRHRVGTTQAALSGAVVLMEANIEEPMHLPEIAGHVGISERQLERLFDAALGYTPSEFYMELRLARARQLLLHTEGKISDVAFQCGFRSAAHFSKRYSAFFGVTPRQDRASRRHAE